MSKTGRIKIILRAVYQTDGTNQMLAVKASNEVEWINMVGAHADGNIALFWQAEDVKVDMLLLL